MFRGICDKKNFTVDQIEQMKLLQSASTIAMGLTAPPTYFAVDDKKGYKACCAPPPSNYTLAIWTPRLGRGLLRPFIEDIISTICAYQQERFRQRPWFNSGYIDEPIQLMCEEFKEWLISLSSAECNEDTLAIVEKRIDYIDRLLDSDEFLPTDPACRESPHTVALEPESKTIYTVLLEIHRILVEEIKQEILKEINNTSSREQLRQLMSYCGQAVQHSLGYLFYIFCDKETPKDFSVDNLVTATTKKFKKIVQDTRAGQLLTILIALDRVGSFESDTTLPIQVEFSNPFFGTDNKLCLPFPNYKMEKILTERNSGINKDACNQPVLEKLMLLHALTAELINLNKVIQLAYHLAGTGGDLLVYGAEHAPINELLNAGRKLIQKFHQTAHGLQKSATDYAINLFRLNSIEHPEWMQNYRSARQYYKNLIADLKLCYTKIAKLHQKVNEIPLNVRLQKAQDELQNFTKISGDYVKSFTQRMQLYQGGQITPQVLPLISDGYATLPSLEAGSAVPTARAIVTALGGPKVPISTKPMVATSATTTTTTSTTAPAVVVSSAALPTTTTVTNVVMTSPTAHPTL